VASAGLSFLPSSRRGAIVAAIICSAQFGIVTAAYECIGYRGRNVCARVRKARLDFLMGEAWIVLKDLFFRPSLREGSI